MQTKDVLLRGTRVSVATSDGSHYSGRIVVIDTISLTILSDFGVDVFAWAGIKRVVTTDEPVIRAAEYEVNR